MYVNLFDTNYYLTANPDLAAAGLNTKEDLFSHFLNAGIHEGRAFSPLIDLKFYQENNPDLAAAGLTTNKQIYEHLQSSGITEGRHFSPLVDLDFYLAVNPDINQAFLGDRTQVFQHLQTSGITENRQFSPLVNLNFYLAANQDVAQAIGSDISTRYQVFTHLQTRGIAEERKYSPVFDHTYYRQFNPDLAAANLNPQQLLTHFQTYGLNEGRRAAANFDIRYYLENNPDLKAAGFNYQKAFQHALISGWREGRSSIEGHTLNEPVFVWKQKLLPLPPPAVAMAESISGIFWSNSGNVHVIRRTSRRFGFNGTYIDKYDSLTGASSGPRKFVLGENYKSVAFDLADNFYVSQGESEDSMYRRNNSHIVTSKHDSSGNSLWQQKILATNLPSHTPGIAVNYIPSSILTVDLTGNVFVAADTTENLGGSYAGGTDTFIIKYDTNGNQQWIKQLGTPEDEFPQQMTVDNVGNLYVAGTTKGSLGGNYAGNTDAWIAKYDSLTGEQIWIRQIGTANQEFVKSINTDSAGNVFLAGTINEIFNKLEGFWLATYDALTGTERSLSQIPVSSDERYFQSFKLDNTGNFYTINSTIDFQPMLSKYNISGIKEWSMPHSDTFSINHATPDNSGNIYALGSVKNNENWELSVGKLSQISDFL